MGKPRGKEHDLSKSMGDVVGVAESAEERQLRQEAGKKMAEKALSEQQESLRVAKEHAEAKAKTRANVAIPQGDSTYEVRIRYTCR